jgi:hypothetical protein
MNNKMWDAPDIVPSNHLYGYTLRGGMAGARVRFSRARAGAIAVARWKYDLDRGGK